jgi:ElaB/YqjD/DUF883 family membrane-anchored ribosome-binding protein
MYENSGSGGSNGHGAAAAASAEEAKEHLRAAKGAAAEAIRSAGLEAKTWSRGRFADLQDRIEAEPYRATAWALGIGFVAGVLITSLARRD